MYEAFSGTGETAQIGAGGGLTDEPSNGTSGDDDTSDPLVTGFVSAFDRPDCSRVSRRWFAVSEWELFDSDSPSLLGSPGPLGSFAFEAPDVVLSAVDADSGTG